ncbi:hypothetical protein [Streptomyces sp. NPDC017520]|uniref:hypothetical protein n=1 Tax=Streptomyces sp. NPDC017520 TaxID=3364998 RepID=UPI0037B109DE
MKPAWPQHPTQVRRSEKQCLGGLGDHRFLDIAPATAAYSRAAYDLETGGRPEDAAIALQRGVDSAVTQDAFAEARLGDLAWSRGEIGRAAE